MKHDNSKPSDITARQFRSSLRKEAQAINERNRVPGDPHYKEPKAAPFHFGSPVDPESQARVEAMERRRAEKRKAASAKTLAEMSQTETSEQ